MVARLDFWSVSLAQKPKSAVVKRVRTIELWFGKGERTDFDSALSVEEDVIGLDVTMDDTLTVQMSEALAGLKAPNTQYQYQSHSLDQKQ